MTGDRECRQCGARTPRPEAIYCSRACYMHARVDVTTTGPVTPDDVAIDGHPPCTWCGEPIVQKPAESAGNYRARRTCGRECAGMASRVAVPTILTGDTGGTGWHERALCAAPGADPEDWFPGERDYQGTRAAKALCEPCPVRVECLAWALANGAEYGVWGGTTPDERRSMARAAYRRKWRAEVAARKAAAGVGT